MSTITEQQKKLATQLWAIVDFCQQHAGKASIAGMDRARLFRFVAFCHFMGKLSVAWNGNTIEAVVFSWADFRERIEARAAEGMSQFEWQKAHAGDVIFVSDAIGQRKGVAKLYQALIEQHPHLAAVPIMTYRRGKLVELNQKHLQRLL